jgi:two-component system, LytTR family, sensor histidine kinase AlgZ
MHPILARRGRLLPYLAACGPLAVIVTALLAKPGGLFLGEAAALAGPLTLAYAFMGLSAWYPCRRFPLGRSRVVALAATLAVGALLTSSLWVFLGAGLARLLSLSPVFRGLPGRFASQVPGLFAAGVLLYLLSAALHYVLIAFAATREAERREASMEILAREAELAALKAQIRPHFLFNSLNSISALASSDPPRAQEMCVRLGDFLRKSLAMGEKTSISILEELALSRAYLSVEELRFGSRLSVEEDLDERGERCLVPPLLLQPLVENAIRHGIATCLEGGTLRLGVSCAGGRLRILIENPLDPDTPARPGTGLGLANVRQRLAARYGQDALFAARRLADSFLVVISVPAELSV